MLKKLKEFYRYLRKNKKILKFVISGSIATGVDILLLAFFTEIVGLWYVHSVVISFTLAFLVSFNLQKFWTFRDHRLHTVHWQVALYFCIAILSLMINTHAIYILVEYFSFHYLIAQIIVGAIIGAINFFVYNFIVFKRSHNRSNKKIKNILLATGIYPPDIGGPATYSKMLLDELPKHGFNVKVITYGDSKLDTGEAIVVNRNRNIFLRYFKYFWQVWKLKNWADVIYIHDLISVGIPVSLVKTLWPQIKIIVRLGGDFLWEKAYNSSWTNKPLSIYYDYPKNYKEKIYIFFYKFVFKKCDKIIFSTNWQKDIYLKYFSLNYKKIIVIENPFPKRNNTHFIESKITINKMSPKTILFAGRLTKIKNVGTLINALLPIKGIKLKIFGSGPEEYNIKQQIKNTSNISLYRAISLTKLKQEIKSSYLVVIPSITDISPNLALECISLDKPVILTKESGFYNRFKGKLIFINPFDKNDISRTIKYLLLEENYNNYLKRIKSINKDYSWTNVINNHLEVFYSL